MEKINKLHKDLSIAIKNRFRLFRRPARRDFCVGALFFINFVYSFVGDKTI